MCAVYILGNTSITSLFVLTYRRYNVQFEAPPPPFSSSGAGMSCPPQIALGGPGRSRVRGAFGELHRNVCVYEFTTSCRCAMITDLCR